MNLEDEALLVERARCKDKEAFSRLITLHSQRIYSIAYNLMGSHEEAEDALQETFLKAYENIHRFKGKAKFSTWLYRICTNICLGRLRKKRPKITVWLDETMKTEEDELERDVIDWSKNPETILLSKELGEVMDRAIQNLPPDYRKVFVLRDVEGFSNREVAEILEESVPAIKSRLHRARMFVRAQLDDYFGQRPLRKTEPHRPFIASK